MKKNIQPRYKDSIVLAMLEIIRLTGNKGENEPWTEEELAWTSYLRNLILEDKRNS